MALKAGYKGIKKYIADKLNALGDLGELATDKEIAEATDKVRADVAPVLAEAKAPTGGITAGDQFYLNDILYTAAADIAAGANIVVTGEGKNADVSSNITVQLAEKSDNSVIGPVENGTTASQAYAVGEHFIRDGKFCTAILSIASGATFTLNTNYVEGTIADNLPKKATFTGTTSATTGNVKISDSIQKIVSIINTGGYVFSLYTIDSGTYVGTWAHVAYPADLSPVMNTVVNIEYYYL